MSNEPFYVARAIVSKVEGVHRRARLAVGAAGTDVDFGVHGDIKRYFKLEGAPDLPLLVDYIAAAVGS